MIGAGSLAAGLVGVLFDQATVSISPAYFTVGKGMVAQDLRSQVALLGFRAALPLGALVAGCGMLSQRSMAGFRWSRWVGTVAVYTLLALPGGALVMSFADPFGFRPQLVPLLDDEGSTRFLVCWGMHIGAYAGILLGIAVAWIRLRSAGGRI